MIGESGAAGFTEIFIAYAASAICCIEPVRKCHREKSAWNDSPYVLSAAGVSFSGSTVNETSCTPAGVSFCTWAIWRVIIGQTLPQVVKMKSATHGLPLSDPVEKGVPVWSVRARAGAG